VAAAVVGPSDSVATAGAAVAVAAPPGSRRLAARTVHANGVAAGVSPVPPEPSHDISAAPTPWIAAVATAACGAAAAGAATATTVTTGPDADSGAGFTPAPEDGPGGRDSAATDSTPAEDDSGALGTASAGASPSVPTGPTPRLPGADVTAGLNEFDVGSKESPRDDGTEELLGTSTAVTTSAAAAAGDAEPTPPRTPQTGATQPNW
jgi:hypothetical protein